MKDTAEKSPVKSAKYRQCGKALEGFFPFLGRGSKRKKEEVCMFQDGKTVRGMLIFIVADIWNCYNMGMKKAINLNLRG